MSSTDTLPPLSPSSDPEAATGGDDGDLWPASGPAKGLRIRLPIAVAALAVVALVGAAGGAALKKPAANTSVQAGAAGTNRGTGALGASGANGATGANGAGTGRLGAGGPGGGVVGTVSKVDGNTVTVTARDGSTATVVVSSATTVSKTVSGSLSDLTAGTTIMVRGTTADGKTTAESITINPANGAGGFGGPPPSGTATPGTTAN